MGVKLIIVKTLKQKVMDNEMHCGECEKFEYDDIDGSGKCFYGAKCHCNDLCHYKYEG